jgi:hypothetical protein
MYSVFLCFSVGGHVVKIADNFIHLENAIRTANFHATYLPSNIRIEVCKGGNIVYTAHGKLAI